MSQLFQCGVVIYELLTTRLPFEGDNFEEIIHNFTTTEPAPPSSFNPNISKDPEMKAKVLQMKNIIRSEFVVISKLE